jgi:hypothetical protein
MPAYFGGHLTVWTTNSCVTFFTFVRLPDDLQNAQFRRPDIAFCILSIASIRVTSKNHPSTSIAIEWLQFKELLNSKSTCLAA